MSTPGPQHEIKDIAAWLPSSNDVAQPRLDGFENVDWFTSGAEALASICYADQKKKARKINVFLPSYFCGQSLRYLRTIPINLCFYSLDKSFLPILPDKSNWDKFMYIDVFVHVHFFGRILDQTQSKKFSDAMGAVLIEDCAHILSPLISKNWIGDFLIFSPHKHFPLPPVGLVFSKNRIDFSFQTKKQFYPIGWFFKQYLKKFRLKQPNSTWGPKWSEQQQNLSYLRVNSAIKKAATKYITHPRKPMLIRQKNIANLYKLLETIDGWKVLKIENSEPPIYLVAVICTSKEVAKRRYELLNKKTRTVMQWPDLPVEIQKQKSSSRQVLRLYDRSLFFFIHQNLNLSKLLKNLQMASEEKGF